MTIVADWRSPETGSYDYNGKGDRVHKVDGSSGNAGTLFLYSPGGQLLAEYTYGQVCVSPPKHTGCNYVNQWIPSAEYVWEDNTLVGYVTVAPPPIPPQSPNPSMLYYVETDHLGTPRQVILPGTSASSDTAVWKWDSVASNSAFGENTPSLQTISFNMRFPGQYFDQETGFAYNSARDYEASTGRYLESDPIGLRGAINSYSYTGANPLRFSDPSSRALRLLPWDQGSGLQ